MATKGAKVSKTGDKRKSSAVEDKTPKKSTAKKEGPESTRKLWKSQDASDDSSDDGGFSDEEEDDAAPPSKKVRQESSEEDGAKAPKQFEKEKGTRRQSTLVPCCNCKPILTTTRRDL